MGYVGAKTWTREDADPPSGPGLLGSLTGKAVFAASNGSERGSYYWMGRRTFCDMFPGIWQSELLYMEVKKSPGRPNAAIDSSRNSDSPGVVANSRTAAFVGKYPRVVGRTAKQRKEKC